MHLPARTDRENNFCPRHTGVRTLSDGPYRRGDNDPVDADCTDLFKNLSFSVTDHFEYVAYFFQKTNFLKQIEKIYPGF